MKVSLPNKNDNTRREYWKASSQISASISVLMLLVARYAHSAFAESVFFLSFLIAVISGIFWAKEQNKLSLVKYPVAVDLTSLSERDRASFGSNAFRAFGIVLAVLAVHVIAVVSLFLLAKHWTADMMIILMLGYMVLLGLSAIPLSRLTRKVDVNKQIRQFCLDNGFRFVEHTEEIGAMRRGMLHNKQVNFYWGIEGSYGGQKFVMRFAEHYFRFFSGFRSSEGQGRSVIIDLGEGSVILPSEELKNQSVIVDQEAVGLMYATSPPDGVTQSAISRLFYIIDHAQSTKNL